MINPNPHRNLDETEKDHEDYDTDIINQGDMVYYGDLWFFNAEPKTKLQFIFDTGSSWVWAGTEDCDTCPSNEKIPKTQLKNCKETKSLKYGSGTLDGQVCETSLSTEDDSEKVLKDFRMIAVSSANMPNLTNTEWDGIVGLLPTSNSGADLLVVKMKEQGLIKHAVFSVLYLDSKHGSTITFGGLDEEHEKDLSKFTFTNLYDENYWSVGIRKMRYGDIDIGGEAKRGILDTGSSLLLLPDKDYHRWLAAVTQGKTCGDYGSYKGCF